MKLLSIVKYQKLFLISVAIILLPIGLSYGLIPDITLSFLFDIQEINLNLLNMLRSVMGFYTALSIFWVIGAINIRYREAALVSLIVFMLGVASGRTINILFDGIPHWLLVFYTISEFMIGFIGLWLVKMESKLK